MRVINAVYSTVRRRRKLTEQGRCCFCEKEDGAVHAIMAALMGRGPTMQGLRCCDECLKKYVWDLED